MSSATFCHRRRPVQRRRPIRARLQVEQLEERAVPSVNNVLVNDPRADFTAQDTQSETAIVLGANSKVVVAFNDSGSHTGSANKFIGYSLSTNGGRSFQDQGTLPDNPEGDGADPALARSSKTGTIVLSSLVPNQSGTGPIENIHVYRSVDNGATFSQPINGAPGFVAGVDFQDKEWIAVDNTPGPGYGNIYMAWRDFSSDPGKDGILFTRSTDDGLTWGPDGGTAIATAKNNHTDTLGAYVTVGPDHAVYVFWWDFTKGPAILMLTSTDQGLTFGDTVTVTGLKTHGGNGGDLGLTDSKGRSFRSNALPQAAVNPVTGDVYVVFGDQANGSADKADIFFTESTDGGNKWSKPIRVNDDATTNDQWQPAIAVTPDGSHVGIFWYDRRVDTANNLIDRFGVIGTVSGHAMSFGPNFRVTVVSFPSAFGQDPFVNTIDPSYMGDYDQATADNSYFYTTWGDNRLSDAFFANEPDVRFAKIPISQYVGGGSTSSASLLVDVANTMGATTPANAPQAPSQRGAMVAAVPASPPAAPMDASAGQGPGPSISQLNLAATMKALDLVFADEGEDGLSEGLSLAVIGS